jgi:hypothetical protein
MTQAVTKKPRAVPPPLPLTTPPGPSSTSGVHAIAQRPPVRVQGLLKQVLLQVDESAGLAEDSSEERTTQWDSERSVEFVNDTYFVGGLSAEAGCSGVFVATYRRVALGTKVHLGFELSNGRIVQARGIVRWTREAGHGERPGVGVAFTEVSESARADIAGLCRSRPPLYFEL